LVVSSRYAVDGWDGEARRLRGLLDAVSSAVDAEYGVVLTWRDEDMSVDRWADPAAIAARMEQLQLTDDAGKIMRGGGATLVIQGYPAPDSTDEMVSATWTAGRDGDWPFTCALTFYARPLPDHTVEWLVDLLNAASTAVQADEARIETTALARGLRKARKGTKIGEITMIPPIDRAGAIPDSITLHPGPQHKPDSRVASADLRQSVANPQSLVGDLLQLADLVSSRTA
jgi:hypothetical protein